MKLQLEEGKTYETAFGKAITITHKLTDTVFKGNDDNQYNANGVLLNSNKPESWNLTKERKK
jgi:hypothetical protein